MDVPLFANEQNPPSHPPLGRPPPSRLTFHPSPTPHTHPPMLPLPTLLPFPHSLTRGVPPTPHDSDLPDASKTLPAPRPNPPLDYNRHQTKVPWDKTTSMSWPNTEVQALTLHTPTYLLFSPSPASLILQRVFKLNSPPRDIQVALTA